MVLASRRIPRMVLAVGATFGVATRVIALDTTTAAARVSQYDALGAPNLREFESCDRHGGDVVYDQGGLFDSSDTFRSCTDHPDFKVAIACVEDENKSKYRVEGQCGTSRADDESACYLTVISTVVAQTPLRLDEHGGMGTTAYTNVKKRAVVSTLVGPPVSPPSTFLGDPVRTSRASSITSMITIPSRSSLTRTSQRSMSQTDDMSVSESTVGSSTSSPGSSQDSSLDSSPGISSTPENTSTEDTTPTLSDSPVVSPTPTPPPDPQKPSGKRTGVIVACSVLGACVLGLLLAFGRKWYLSRRREQKKTASGILTEPRQKSPNDKRPSDISETTNGGTTTIANVSNGGVHSHKYPQTNGSVTPPHLSTSTSQPKSETNALSRKSGPRTPEVMELSTLPPSARESTITTDQASILSPVLSMLPKSPGRYDNPSPPFTATPTPISPLFPVAASTSSGAEPPLSTSISADTTAVPTPTTAGAGRSNTRASHKTAVSHVSSHDTLRPSNDINEYVLKSSAMSHMAGPYLTAEKALGEGFWEAEREQLEADKAIGKAHDGGTTHDKKDGGPRKSDTVGDHHVNAP